LRFVPPRSSPTCRLARPEASLPAALTSRR
jgi:hypothetical protein